MPGFPVLTTLQPIFGLDAHKSLPPPPPVGPLILPHPVVWVSGLSQKTGFMWAIAATSRASSPESGCLTPTRVGPGYACGRTHDAGPHPGHIWPNALLPLILLSSASKAEFGSGTVKTAIAPQAGGSADMCINVAFVLNTNLDCQDFPFPPLPSGMCFTTNYTVYAGFTFIDFLRGIMQMFMDAVVTWLVGLGCAALSVVLSGVIGKLLGRAALSDILGGFKGIFNLGGQSNAVSRAVISDYALSGRAFVEGWRAIPGALASAWKQAPVEQIVGPVTGLLGTFGAGTPIGYAPKDAKVGGWNPDPHSTVNAWYSSWIDNWHK